MDRATDGLGSDASGVVDSVESVSESAEGFVDRRGAGLAAGAAAVGAAASASSGASEVDEADYQSASDLETDGIASGEFAGGYGAPQSEAVAAPSYEAPDAHAPVADYSAGQVDGLTAPADFDSSPVADRVSSEFSSPEYRAPDSLEHDAAGSDYAGADFAASGFAPPDAPVADATTALDQPIPGQQLPSEYSSDHDEEFSSSYQGAYTEPGFEADSGTGVSDTSTAVPAALGGPQAPTYDTPTYDTPGFNGDASVGGNDLSVNEYQVAEEATPGVDGDPWDDPSVDTAVNPVVRAESPQGPAPGPLDGPSSLPDPGPDPFGTGSSGGPAFDDGRFASYDNGGQLDRQQSRGPLLAPPVHEQSKGGRGRGLLLSLVVLAALALAGLAGFFFYQQQQGGDGETAEVAEAGADAAPGSLTNPHDSSRAVQIEYVAEDIAQVWTIQATSSAQTDLGSSTEIQADLTVANGNDDGAAALADLVVSIVDANGEVLASGANDCTNTQAMSWGQSVAGGTSVSGPICWVVPSDSVDGALLGIESTKAQGRIHIQLP